MNIWEVAKATGLTKKAIRYYEKMGLLSPAINQDNNYRDYSCLTPGAGRCFNCPAGCFPLY
ncbi:MAG: MerR family DNA-binding transcriptional regulator [Clostridia bacterium]|nr:MerR family DNA-binding transcriptional regulator [Clostridia bacterium]